MALFEDPTKEVHDWHDVCQNADPFLPPDEGMKVFDAVLNYMRETDRSRVRDIIRRGRFNKMLFIRVLLETWPKNRAISIVASELYHKAPEDLLCSALALTHNGGGNANIKFPSKITPIPPKLLGAFGLRSNELDWFSRLASNERFVLGILGSISPDHYKHIPLDITTLLKKKEKEATAPQLTVNGGEKLW